MRFVYLIILILNTNVALANTEIISVPPLLTNELLQVTVSLIIVLIFIVMGALILRYFIKTTSATGSNLKILAGLSLGGRERIVLIQVGDRQLLLGVSPGSVRTLYVIEPSLIEPSLSINPAEKFTDNLYSKIHDQELSILPEVKKF